MAKFEYIAALDIGTTKVCCFIAEKDSGDRIQVTGIGYHASEGLKAGSIVDMQAAEQSVLAAVHAAEQMAGTTIREVIVNVSAGEPTSGFVDIDTELTSQAVGDRELGRLFNDQKLSNLAARDISFMRYPLGMKLTDRTGCASIGLYGHKLGVRLHTVTAAPSVLQNVVNCVERCRLQIADFAVNPYAAGIACVVEDELDLGVTVVDMGGGTTSIGIFFEGALVHVDMIPIGGAHITSDIAQGFSTPRTMRNGLKRSTELACLPRQMRPKSSAFPGLAKKKTRRPPHCRNPRGEHYRPAGRRNCWSWCAADWWQAVWIEKQVGASC